VPRHEPNSSMWTCQTDTCTHPQQLLAAAYAATPEVHVGLMYEDDQHARHGAADELPAAAAAIGEQRHGARSEATYVRGRSCGCIQHGQHTVGLMKHMGRVVSCYWLHLAHAATDQSTFNTASKDPTPTWLSTWAGLRWAVVLLTAPCAAHCRLHKIILPLL
jgi:hypothetical protein